MGHRNPLGRMPVFDTPTLEPPELPSCLTHWSFTSNPRSTA